MVTTIEIQQVFNVLFNVILLCWEMQQELDISVAYGVTGFVTCCVLKHNAGIL